jgi:hypothetical protein
MHAYIYIYIYTSEKEKQYTSAHPHTAIEVDPEFAEPFQTYGDLMRKRGEKEAAAILLKRYVCVYVCVVCVCMY